MKMNEVVVGKVYRQVRVGRDGVRMTHQHVMVDATYVAKQFSSRQDRVQVHNVSPVVDDEGNPTGEFQYTGSFDQDGNPYRFLLLARELISLEEAEERNAQARAEKEISERRHKARQDFSKDVAKQIAMRLGISDDSVSVNSTVEALPDEEGNYSCEPYRASIDKDGLAAMLEHDPDPEIIVAALVDHFGVVPNQVISATPFELAELIVGALRNDSAEKEDEDA